MQTFSRRDFIRRNALGLTTLGIGHAALTLDAIAAPTESSGDVGDYGAYLKEKPRPTTVVAVKDFAPTEDNILGPFYRPGAPYRAKITPPLEAGTVLLISGHVWAHDTRKPLSMAVVDIWQANANGRYDNDDPGNPPKKGVFLNRARLVVDEQGYYEYETIHPGRYQIGENIWRPSHIHYMVQHPGYKALITQLYFEGDPHNEMDSFIRKSLIIGLRKQPVGTGFYETGTFDIVLAKEG